MYKIYHIDNSIISQIPYIRVPILVGGFNPSEKYESQLGSPNVWKHNPNVPNRQPNAVWDDSEYLRKICVYISQAVASSMMSQAFLNLTNG
jgi:hypothetical protein